MAVAVVALIVVAVTVVCDVAVAVVAVRDEMVVVESELVLDVWVEAVVVSTHVSQRTGHEIENSKPNIPVHALRGTPQPGGSGFLLQTVGAGCASDSALVGAAVAVDVVAVEAVVAVVAVSVVA